MPVNPVPNGPSTSVLAYNGDSPRGWNDPPTFAFSKSTGSRPKLDLRKRVSHQQALHGTQTPPGFNPSSPTTYGVNGGSEVTDRMASLSFHSSPVTTGNVTGLPPSTTPPQQPKVLHTHHTSAPPPVTMYTPQQTTTGNYHGQQTTTAHHHHGHNEHHRSHSLPTLFMPAALPDLNNPPHHVEPVSTPEINSVLSDVNASTEPTQQAPGYLGQPLFALKDHSFEPVKTHNDSGVRSTAEIGDHLDDHSETQIFHPVPQHVGNGIMHSTPPMGHITPPKSTTQTGRVSPFSKPARAISPHPAIPVAPPTNTTMPLTPSPLPVMPITAPSFPTMPITQSNHMAVQTLAVTTSSLPPPMGMAVTSAPSIHGVAGSSVNHLTPHQPPPIPTVPVGSTTPTPPRTVMSGPPGSLSTGSTPRCLSPEDENTDISDEEGLKATIDALNDVIQKYKLEKRICDDIARKLNVMSKMWREGKLGKTVKSRMIKLARALDDGDGEEAHHIHVSIIVDHVAEVNQWMVAVKRLISMVRHKSPANS